MRNFPKNTEKLLLHRKFTSTRTILKCQNYRMYQGCCAMFRVSVVVNFKLVNWESNGAIVV